MKQMNTDAKHLILITFNVTSALDELQLIALQLAICNFYTIFSEHH